MVEKDAKLLAEKYRKGQCSPEELALIESWYVQLKVEAGAPDHEQIASSLVEVWAALHLDTKPAERLWPRIAVAAAAVAAIVLGVWFYSSKYQDASIKTGSMASVNDIAPGRNGATITLASGEVIALSGEKKGVIVGDELKYVDHTPVIHTNSLPRDDDKGESGMAQTLTASTAKGQMYEFTLPDGTHVWLNADSKISFPSQFNGKERKILLSGEAYFAVVHNAKQPFRVESKGQVVEDIGTEFNINAYADESSTKTTLVEGRAKVNAIILKPNQQAALINSTIKVTTIDPEQAIAWKNNKFMFESQDIREIMTMIARWYNVKVVYEGPVPEDKFGGSVSRFDNISKVLNALEKTKNVHFRVEERTVYVSK